MGQHTKFTKQQREIYKNTEHVQNMKHVQLCTCFVFCTFLRGVKAQTTNHMHLKKVIILHIEIESFGKVILNSPILHV